MCLLGSRFLYGQHESILLILVYDQMRGERRCGWLYAPVCSPVCPARPLSGQKQSSSSHCDEWQRGNVRANELPAFQRRAISCVHAHHMTPLLHQQPPVPPSTVSINICLNWRAHCVIIKTWATVMILMDISPQVTQTKRQYIFIVLQNVYVYVLAWGLNTLLVSSIK